MQSLGLNEAWLQNQIWENPSCLDLGELEGVTRERIISSGGRLDILLKNPVDDSMYEVETMLGDTDPDHIIRTIEYWDLIKRKWPQRQHFAVLVAERITKRFFNVIQLLSGAIPLIAIQANIVQHVGGNSLHFTKILDVFEEIDDDTAIDGGMYDESYWAKRSKEALGVVKYLQELTLEIYGKTELHFNKYSITIASNSYNQMVVRNRSGKNVMIELRYGAKKEEIKNVLEQFGIQHIDQHRHFKFTLPERLIKEKADVFIKIAQLNKEWWVG